MDNTLRNICRKVDYNTYTNIQNALIASGFGANVAALFFNNDYLKNFLYGYSYAAFFSGVALIYIGGNKYTKDIYQIKKEYQKFIDDYNLLNEAFDLKDPIEINTMFHYLVYNGYLSKDKSFVFSRENSRDLNNLLGVELFKGNGVCRHMAAMLSDILNNYGIYSNSVGVYYNDCEEILTTEKLDKMTNEVINKFINNNISIADEEVDIIINEALKELGNITIPDIDLNNIDKVNGNHAITYAFKDDKSYFLDATNCRVLRQSKKYPEVLYDEYGKYIIKDNSTNILNNNEKFDAIVDILNVDKYNYISKDEEDKMINNTNRLCNENKDILDLFYNNNKEIYEDVSEKVLKIKKTIFNYI